MIELEAVVKRKKKVRSQKSKVKHRKLKQQQQLQQKKKIQLTHKFEESEKEVMTLLENTSLLSESSNNSHRDSDNKSPSERFFFGSTQQQHDDEELNAEDSKGKELWNERRQSKESVDDLSATNRSMQPALASTFIQIEPDDMEVLVRVERTSYLIRQNDFIFKPKLELEANVTAFSLERKIDRNTIIMLNRFIVQFKARKEKTDQNLLNILKDSKAKDPFCNDTVSYKTLCDFRFKPVFVEPSLNSLLIPSKKLLILHIKDLRFTEHPLLQQEHRLANTLELLYEHREQRFQEKITEKIYADLQIERNILNELLASAETGCHAEEIVNKEKRALTIEHHLYKVKALREKLYDEELKNKQLLQEILTNWVKLKSVRTQQEQQFTTFKLRIKIEDLKAAESKKRQKLYAQRFTTDLNEIFREQLEDYYRNKRLRQLHKSTGEYVSRMRKPNIEELAVELQDRYAKCFNNPKEPRIDVERTVAHNDRKNLAAARKMRSYFMRVFLDHQMVGETRVCRLESDLSVIVDENMGIVLNRSLPKDITIKLYKKSKISSAQKIGNIFVPLPLTLPTAVAAEPNTIAIAFSSHKQPISGYLRINIKTDKEFYPNELLNKIFPSPHDHTTIPKSLLREWYHKKLLQSTEISDPAWLEASCNSDTEDDTEKTRTLAMDTCTFQEDLLQFCDPLEVETNQRLRLLRSRYLKNDARTRELKFIPMLDHEVEFEWETEETLLEAGNWMDPIDLQMHEGKKYLRNLYAAMKNQCARLNKMVESQENLLLNDEPITWTAFFHTIKLLFQPKLNLNVGMNMSLSTNIPSLTADCAQDFKIICSIIRAAGIPVRISNTEDTESKERSTPEHSNVFLLQNFKYSNVRPFVAISYKDKFGRTMTAEGSNPTWNEQLILPIRGSLADLHDDLRISLYDEVVDNQLNDDPGIKNIDIYQRIQNNWLGEYRIPINAILTQRKMDTVFELTRPKILVGYKSPSLETTATIMSEQFPQIKESIRLWCFISMEPVFELPLINTKCLECSELIEVKKHLTDWSVQAMEIQPQRFVQPLICTTEGKRLCITRILQPLAPPIEASENLLDSACRFVSLIAQPKFYDPCLKFNGVWLNNQLLMDVTWGSPKDLGVLLCNYLLYMGVQCSLVLGMADPYGECTFVFYRNEEGEMFFIDPCTGKRYGLKDVFCPLQTIQMVVTQNNFYLNIQTESRVSMMNFNWSDASCWLPGFTKKNPAPLGGFQSTEYKYRMPHSVSELQHNIERKIMKKISAWRTMRKTIWNRAFQARLLSILQDMEHNITFGSGSSYEELKYNNMLAAEFPNFKIFGFTLNFAYTNLSQVSERIKTTGLHLNSNKNVEFSLAVHIHPYPNNILSVWLFLITVVPA